MLGWSTSAIFQSSGNHYYDPFPPSPAFPFRITCQYPREAREVSSSSQLAPRVFHLAATKKQKVRAEQHSWGGKWPVLPASYGNSSCRTVKRKTLQTSSRPHARELQGGRDGVWTFVKDKKASGKKGWVDSCFHREYLCAIYTYVMLGVVRDRKPLTCNAAPLSIARFVCPSVLNYQVGWLTFSKWLCTWSQWKHLFSRQS